jgi:iron(III) transport system substrate-binding protein
MRTRSRSRWIGGLAGLVALCTVVAACGSSKASTATGSTSASSTDTLTLYSGQHEETTDAIVAAFEKSTGIKVKIRNDDEDVLADQMLQEGSRSPADVFYTENSPPLMKLQEHGLLSPIEPTTLSAVDAKYSSPSGDWIGVSARTSVLDYNTDDLKPDQVPTSVLDLADPKWKGKLGIAPGETDFQPIVTSIAHSEGQAAAEKWLDAVKANGASHSYPDNETMVQEINQGKVEIGLINHYYWYRLKREEGASKMHSALSYLAPQDVGYVLDVSGAGVLKSSKHQAEAQKLVAFMVSAQGETILAQSDSYEYPVGSGVAANPTLKPFDQLQPTPLTIAELGDGSEAVSLLQKAELL